MTEFYQEKVAQCKRKIWLSEIGYRAKAQEISAVLAEASDTAEVDKLIDELIEVRAAMELLRSDLKFYQDCYSDEAKKILEQQGEPETRSEANS